MHTLKTLMLKISASILLILSTITLSNAAELNTESFSGTINTTLTSGLTIRTERDCENLDGYSYTGALGTYVDGSGEGCATALSDTYGNTTTKQLSRSSGSNDDGSMNFDSGDVVSAKQKFYTEIIGTFSSGIGANLSFTGFTDPTLDISSPLYAPLTASAKNDFERDFDILNAYVYGSTDVAEGYVDWTIGRQVTNWGEATFIPIGMNGFTTNALDLTKLRGPGASIREALVPTGQITLSTSLDGGMNLEAFYQLEHRAVQLDPAGSFYGNEIVGTGSSKMITIGNYNKENVEFDDCNYSQTGTDTTACDWGLVADFRTTAGVQAHDTSYLLFKGLQATTATEAAAGQAFGAAKTFGNALSVNLSNADGAIWTDAYTASLNTYLGSLNASGVAAGGSSTINATGGVNKTFYSTNTVGYKLTTLAGTTVNTNADADSGAALGTALALLDTDIVDDSLNTYAAVSIRRADDFIQEARDDGQFGLKLSGYSDSGAGFDWALNYSRYHSKTPYVRIKGKGGIYAGDVYGIISEAGDTAEGSRSAAQANLVTAVTNGAYSAGVCNAALSANLAKGTYAVADSDGTYYTAAQAASKNYDGTLGNWGGATTEQKNLSDQHNWQETINGGKVHNSAKCYATATAFTNASTAAFAAGDSDAPTNIHTALYGVSEVLLSAITPLNLAKYELIYPEDLDALGFSFNTNINGTAIQGEIVYRPDFPLAHSAGDQISQIGDVSGAFDLLDMFAFNTVAGKVTDNTNNDGTDQNSIGVGTDISTNFYNPDTTGMTAAQIFQQGVRLNMLGMATYSAGVFTPTRSNLWLPASVPAIELYKNWMASTNSGTAQYLGLAGVRKGVFDTAYVAACSAAEAATVCAGETLGAGDYNTNYYNNIAAVQGAYEFGTTAFNRSSLPALTQANTRSDYTSTAFVKKDVWTYDLGTTTTFSASHPITTTLGADSVAFLSEVGAVMISSMNNSADGYIARNGYQEGIGQEKCNGPFGAAVAGGTSFGGAAGALTHLGAGQVDALFGNGGYCEGQNGADPFSLSYRLIGVATYNNFGNSGWSVSPSVVWAHDPLGYGPSSMGGFVEDKMTMSLSLNAKKSDALSLGVSYVSHLAGPEVDASSDKDTVTMSMSYSF
jgi:hypothetical protein